MKDALPGIIETAIEDYIKSPEIGTTLSAWGMTSGI